MSADVQFRSLVCHMVLLQSTIWEAADWKHAFKKAWQII